MTALDSSNTFRRSPWMLLPLLAMLLVTCTAAENQTPIEHKFITLDGQPPPSSIEEMVAFADAVVVAEHSGTTVLSQGTPIGGYTPTSTSHELQLTEIIKFNPALPALGAPFRIVVPGGDRDLGTHIERVSVKDSERVNLDGVYVVFLHWVPATNELVLLWNHAGLQEITSGIVKSGSLNFTQHSGKSAATFLAELRDAASN